MNDENEATIRLKVDYVLDDCEQGTMLRVPETGQILLLNPTAVYVVEQLRHGSTAEQLRLGLMENFDADESVVHEDVARCLMDLIENGLIEDAQF